MILHIFPHEKFTEPYISMINKNVDEKEHIFFIYGNHKKVEAINFKKYNNVIFFNKDSIIKFIEYTYKAKKIILHSLFNEKFLLLYFYSNRGLLKKSSWVIWGSDLYMYDQINGNEYKGYKAIKKNINEYIRRSVIRNIGEIVTHIKGDYNLAKEWYGANGEHKYCFMYLSNCYKEIEEIEKEVNTKVIQVGNSATPTNCHKEIFLRLKNYREEDIQIICPLAYGDDKYKEEIVALGYEIFGEKFKPILEMMSFDEYTKMLNNIDIAIFNHNRQQSVGNMITLLGMGKKVYIRDSITTWEFCEQHNLKVYDINELEKNLFIEQDGKNIRNNKNIIRTEFSEEKLIDYWKKIFD